MPASLAASHGALTDFGTGPVMTSVELEPAAPALVPASSPQATLARQVETADALTQVIQDRELFANIQGKRYLTVDAWLLLASLVGVSTCVVETEPTENGYRAAVEARRVTDGLVVGRAEAICTRDERMWAKRDEYALLGMAQTRATSRALRGCLGAIVSLAGFQTVGAEEMPAGSPVEPQIKAEKVSPGKRVWNVAVEKGVSATHVQRIAADELQIPSEKASLQSLTDAEANQIIERIKAEGGFYAKGGDQ